MDQFVLLHQDDNNLYIKILSSVYITPYCGLNKDDHRYTFTLGDKKFFGCLTTDYESFTQSSIYPYIVTITFQYYIHINQPITNQQALDAKRQRDRIEQQVDDMIEQKINQVVDLEQFKQFKQLQEKVDLLQQRVIDITRKVKRYVRL